GRLFFPDTLALQEIALRDAVASKVAIGSPTWRLEEIRCDSEGSQARVETPYGAGVLRLQLVGSYQLSNALLALAVALHLGSPLEGALEALSELEPPALRGQRRALQGGGGGLLWLDCYNANPQSTLASTLAFWESGARGPLILGSMAELGEEAAELHEKLATSLAAKGRERGALFALGPYRASLARAFQRGGGEAFTSAEPSGSAAELEEVAEWLSSTLRRGDSVFVKGSRGGRLERLDQMLQRRDL
ncbi:MAG: hypothetical protein VYD19_02195, partial [Myxococcota bacterium]|nr:hypothetical protein [Myxococcota bacterium]